MTRLLVIDDSPEDRDLIRMLASDLDSYALTTASGGAEALEILGTPHPVDCTLLDFRLDGENGLDVLHKLRNQRPDCPVILMTGQGNEATAVAAMNAGASDYLVKSSMTAISLGKAVEQSLERARLQRTVAEQADMLRRTDRLDALGQLATGVAHDFNNILATIRYATDLLMRETATDEGARYLASARHAIDRGAALSTRLLSFASQASGAVTTRQTCDVLEAIEGLAGPALDRQIALNFCNDAPGLAVTCDQAQLDMALLNLVLNARDAVLDARDTGSIEVRATPVQEAGDGTDLRVAISVTDNGPGMSEDVRARCTDPFFTTKAGTAGAGLGLALVYGFVQQSGGALRITSAPNAGTTIEMTLPASTLAVSAVEDDPSPPTVVRRRILLVENEPEQLMMLETLMSGLGYTVRLASSASEAMGLIVSGDPVEVIVTDIRLSDGSGFDLARDVRTIRHDLPVVYISGLGGEMAEQDRQVPGPILQKPVDPVALSRAIEEQVTATLDGARAQA